MRRLPSVSAIALAALVVCTLATPVGAAPDSAATAVRLTLSEVVVTAMRGPRQSVLVPYSSWTTSLGTSRAGQRHIGAVLIHEIPGVNGSSTGPGQTTVRISGLTGYHVQQCVDDMRTDNFIQRSGPTEVARLLDLFAFDRVEIVRGPAGVLWGSGAAGGILNAISRPLVPTTPARPGATVLLRGATAERSGTLRVSGEAPGPGGTSWRGGFTGRRFGQMQGGRATGRQPGTEYEEGGLNLRVEAPVAGATMSALYQGYRQFGAPRTHVTDQAIPFMGTTVGTDLARDYDRARDHVILQWRAREPASGPLWLIGFSWQRQDEDEHRVTGSGSVRRQGVEVSSLGATVHLATDSRVGRLSFGGDGYWDYRVQSYSTTNPIQGPVGDDSHASVAGLFVQDEWRLGRALRLLAGARLTDARAFAARVRDPLTGQPISLAHRSQALTTSVRLLHEFRPGRASWFAGRSEGFRAPNLSDLSRFDLAEGNQIETPSVGLRPERFVAYEVGATWRARWASGSASVFHTEIRDLIVRQPTGRMIGTEYEVRHANAGDGWVRGAQADVTIFAGARTSATAWAGGNIGEIDQYPTSEPVMQREPLSRTMPFTAGLRARRNVGRAGWLEGEVFGAGHQGRLSSGDRVDTSRIPPGGTPGYVVAAARGGTRVVNMDVTLAVENLANADYRIHGSGINEPGRNVVLVVARSF